MSRIEGRPLYESLEDGSSDIGSLEHLGRIIRSLHEAGFSHGDLTSHNVIISDDGQLHLIDFGLAKQSPELEHLGLDLQVLKECLTASHSFLEGAVDAVVRGYLDGDSAPSKIESASRVIERFQKITGRVRYHG
jgi:TP53 regulating kinase-like protein